MVFDKFSFLCYNRLVNTIPSLADFLKESEDEITIPAELEEFKKEVKDNLPVPFPDYLRKQYAVSETRHSESEYKGKYEKEYNAFCKWAALPTDLRKPKTSTAFEIKWRLPRTYTEFFRDRPDFQEKRLRYFWDWMMDKFPDVVYAIYKRAVSKSSTDARVLAELMGKHLEVHKPKVNVAPMILVGVPQERINNLFVPKGFENVKDITPKGIG